MLYILELIHGRNWNLTLRENLGVSFGQKLWLKVTRSNVSKTTTYKKSFKTYKAYNWMSLKLRSGLPHVTKTVKLLKSSMTTRLLTLFWKIMVKKLRTKTRTVVLTNPLLGFHILMPRTLWILPFKYTEQNWTSTLMFLRV